MKKISFLEAKPLQYYKGIRINADTGLHDQLTEIICSTLTKGSKILDFGAGEGALSQRLYDIGYQVYSADEDQENFKAQTKFERLDFNNSYSVESFKKNHENEFDMVLGIEVIEHIENPWRFIRDLKEMVKPGGYILISTPNVTSWYSRINFLFRGRFHQFDDIDRHYGHINPITVDELKLICEQSGVLVEKVAPGGWLPRLWLSWDPKSIVT